MTKNPFINAFSAIVYIFLVALVMFYGTKFSGPFNPLIGPVAVISLFTLSAAVMGYIFLYQPVIMFVEGKKKPAINLFFQTLIIFAGFTTLTLAVLFSGILSLK